MPATAPPRPAPGGTRWSPRGAPERSPRAAAAARPSALPRRSGTPGSARRGGRERPRAGPPRAERGAGALRARAHPRHGACAVRRSRRCGARPGCAVTSLARSPASARPPASGAREGGFGHSAALRRKILQSHRVPSVTGHDRVN